MKRVSLFILSLLFLATALQSDKILTSGWYQQFLPAGGYKPIAGMVFVDSLTGFIVTGADTVGNTNYIFKTTDGGDNWAVNATITDKFYKLQFINDSTGLAIANNKLFKTFNKGINWNYITMPIYPIDMSVLNKDTIFCVDGASIMGGFWRTTNAGTSWVKLVNFGSCNPSGIYFYNKNIGYINRCTETWKTTDGGFNWFQISGPYGNMYFIDSLLGYKAAGYVMSKTTNGGLNWTTQQLPNTALPGVIEFYAINKDTLWSVGGSIIKNNTYYGIVYKSTNGGNNWGFQIPLDTNIIDQYRNVHGFNKRNIWAYYLRNTGVHTNIGGNDTTIFTSVNNEITNIPKDFILEQNYPNPFNPVTSIKYQVLRNSNVKLITFNITGQEITTLVNERKSAGTYEVTFDGSNLSSGIYFYTLFANGKRIETKRMVLVR